LYKIKVRLCSGQANSPTAQCWQISQQGTSLAQQHQRSPAFHKCNSPSATGACCSKHLQAQTGVSGRDARNELTNPWGVLKHSITAAQLSLLLLLRPFSPLGLQTIAYDGTNFAGFQYQTPKVRTVQGELEKAAARVLLPTGRVVGN